MTPLETLLNQYKTTIQPILPDLAQDNYSLIDLSVGNAMLTKAILEDSDLLTQFVSDRCQQNDTAYVIGGYLEKRALYELKEGYDNHDGDTKRNIHLGLDIWCQPQTKLYVPLEGIVHSFKDNVGEGNYGPTIILQHQLEGMTFHTLYGHLDRDSLETIQKGMRLKSGAYLASVGNKQINGGWPPHLHLQLISDMADWEGDYPGVAAENEIDYYQSTCPDPMLILTMQ